jgi:hypothetical protein
MLLWLNFAYLWLTAVGILGTRLILRSSDHVYVTIISVADEADDSGSTDFFDVDV